MDQSGGELISLGYDVRVMAADNWDAAWNRMFLLRPDVERPLSVDRMTWKILFGAREEDNPLGLWNSVRSAVAACPEVASANADAPALIEISVLADSRSLDYWRLMFQGYLRPEDDEGYSFNTENLGYDVADRYLVSGLSNCMLSTIELAELRLQWASKINSYGLFDRATEATAFSAACDFLISEHSPFSVYRLRRIVLDPPAT